MRLLRGLDWGVGGTTLLHHLGIHDAAPHDLDCFTTVAHFPIVAERLAARFGAGTRTPSDVHVSTCFLTFTAPDGTHIDLLAGAAVMKAGVRHAWDFDPKTITRDADDIPWMRAEDWLELYRLFDRPERVKTLDSYLRRRLQAVSP